MAAAITRFRLLSPAPAALADFYRDAFGFARRADGRLELGPSLIELAKAGHAYPPDVTGNDPRFQHLAIVVSDMAQAYTALATVAGWTPISLVGPEALPTASGGAKAFKFRDPDGHPLELLCFAPGGLPPRWANRTGKNLGIAHSAIATTDAARSLAFYAAIGFGIASRQLNTGVEQARLDGLASGDATSVEVIGLSTGAGGPNLELLAYNCPAMTAAPPVNTKIFLPAS